MRTKTLLARGRGLALLKAPPRVTEAARLKLSSHPHTRVRKKKMSETIEATNFQVDRNCERLRRRLFGAVFDLENGRYIKINLHD